MGKKNKRTNGMETGEINIKIKTKKTKSEELERITEISLPSKKNKGNDQKNTKTGRKNKKLSTSNGEPDIDKSCHGDLEEDSKDKVPIGIVDQKIKSENKNKKRKSKDVEANNIEPVKVKKVKTNKDQEANGSPAKHKNINKLYDDVSVQESLVNNNKKKLNFLNEDEAAVKDEDIDKFCDEVTDEDNETYENWVKLFEDNFKKSKNITS